MSGPSVSYLVSVSATEIKTNFKGQNELWTIFPALGQEITLIIISCWLRGHLHCTGNTCLGKPSQLLILTHPTIEVRCLRWKKLHQKWRWRTEKCSYLQYQPSGEGGTCSPPEKSKMAARGPENDRWGLERGLPLDFLALPSTFSRLVF